MAYGQRAHCTHAVWCIELRNRIRNLLFNLNRINEAIRRDANTHEIWFHFIRIINFDEISQMMLLDIIIRSYTCPRNRIVEDACAIQFGQAIVTVHLHFMQIHLTGIQLGHANALIEFWFPFFFRSPTATSEHRKIAFAIAAGRNQTVNHCDSQNNINNLNATERYKPRPTKQNQMRKKFADKTTQTERKKCRERGKYESRTANIIQIKTSQVSGLSQRNGFHCYALSVIHCLILCGRSFSFLSISFPFCFLINILNTYSCKFVRENCQRKLLRNKIMMQGSPLLMNPILAKKYRRENGPTRN